MAKSTRSGCKAAAAILLGCYALPALFDLTVSPLRRVLLLELQGAEIYPWASRLVAPVASAPDPARETALFWHMPKSGGTTVKNLYKCMGKAVAIFHLDIEKTLVQSDKVDILVSTCPAYAIEQLFDPSHRARVLAVFRHPVDRLISKFFYLQAATHERSYRPEWKGMDLLVWAREHNQDNNNMIRALAGEVTDRDLRQAKETVRERFVVGLTEDIEESVRRFNVMMGINDNTTGPYERCMSSYFGNTMEHANANPHPEVKQDSPAWQLLAKQNSYDIRLYEYVLKVFEEQRAQIDFHASSIVAVSAAKE